MLGKDFKKCSMLKKDTQAYINGWKLVNDVEE
jgi:hypothetical protein